MIYLIKDSIMRAFYSEDREESELELSWLLSESEEKQSFKWYCNLVGLCPTWVKTKMMQSTSTYLNATDRSPGNFLSYV